MSAPWTMPDWMRQYVQFMSDTGEGVEKVMSEEFKSLAAMSRASTEGRALCVNAQVGLLVALHAAGLLKEVPPCTLKS